LKLEKHPDKTFIGKVEKGFDFLGYHFSPRGLMIANKTWTKFVALLHRLYEQKKTSADCGVVLGEYVRRWQRWTKAGINKTLKTPHDGGADNRTRYIDTLLSPCFPSCYPECNKS